MTKLRAFVLVLCLGLALAFSVSGLDLALWRHLDGGRPPLRSFISDQHYYHLRTHRVLEEGRALGGAYYNERLGDRPRYPAFETSLVIIGKALVPFIGTNPAFWAVVMRAFTTFGVFAALFFVFRRFARLAPVPAAALAALGFLWFQLRSLYMGNSLTTWYLPSALFGLLALHVGLSRPAAWRRFAWLLGATLLFLTHPVAFAVGAMTIGLALLMKFAEERTRASFGVAAAWTAATVAIGAFAYGRFAAQATDAMGEMLARNLFVASRLPALPLTSLWVGALCLMLACLMRRAAPEDRPAWQALLALGAAGLIGLNLNVLTGSYFLNDHYGFLLPLLPLCAAATALRLPAAKPAGAERVAIIACATVLAGWSVRLLSDGQSWQQARAFAHLGTILSFLVLSWIALGGRVERPKRHRPFLAAAILGAAALLPIASAVNWLEGYRALQVAIQDERPIIAALEGLPPGVVLSDPVHAETVAGYTPHRAYWSAYAFGDDASSEELRARWRDALRFFPSRWDTAGSPVGTRSLYGHMDLMCLEQWPLVQEEHAPYRLLERAIGFRKSLCRPMPDEASWEAFVEAERPASGSDWRARYRLDYLLLDLAEGQTLPPELAPTFEPVRQVGPIEVYRYLGGA